MFNPESPLATGIVGRIRPHLWGYASVLIVVAAAVAIRTLVDPVMGKQSAAVFLGAVLVGAWIGGLGPALFCMVLLHLVHGYWFQNPPGLLDPTNTMASVVSLTAYYAIAIIVGLLSQVRTSAQRRARIEHSEAVSQREQLHTTLSCMADGVLVTDVHGRVTLINPAAEGLTGWSVADSHGKPWWEILSLRREDGQGEVENPIERVLAERRVVHERLPLVLTSRTGHSFPIAYSAAPVNDPDGQATGVVLIFRDESERRRTELALRNADQRKDEFLATLAHELRNPLAPITMGLELLKMSEDRQAAEQVRSMMERQTHHMVRLIDDLMDVARITRGKLELRRSQVELADIIRDAVEATRPTLEKGKHQFSVRLPERPASLYADANRLTQVLTNLLNNAAKYTPPDGRIELNAECSGSDVIISVSDTGIGIPADKLDTVFDMFSQVKDCSDDGPAGLGIGLTLVKRLVEMHGGSVEADSRGRNLGTTFTVRLPALPMPLAERNGESLDSRTAPLAAKRRVLVVDDNADALATLSRLVELMGNEVRQARDGIEALDVARTYRPDIVLMDLGMPRLDGYQAARRIRQEPWGRKVALIATTGWGQDEDRKRSAEAGFDRHLVKPIETGALQELFVAPPRSRVTGS